MAPILTVLGQARDYIARGWSVLPIHAPAPAGACTCGCDRPECKDRGKHPATPYGQWKAYQDRRATDAELSLWFGDKLANIGIIAGEISGGLLIIDADDPATYAALCYCYPELVHTLTAATAKGFHIYLHAPQPTRTTTFDLNGHRHHVKYDGQYVVAPPSTHYSGPVYRWRDEAAPVLDVDLARLASALQRLGARKVEPETSANPPGWASDLIRNGARIGERDDATFRLAAHLAHYLPHDDCLAILELWAEHRCAQPSGDPWGAPQVAAKLRSAQGYHPPAQ